MRRILLIPLFAGLLVACDGAPLTPADAVLPDGGRYRGQIVDGLLQGEGRIDYPNGSHYQGNFKDGQWHGRGSWTAANGDRYEGEFRHGLFEGQGRFSYAEGGVYEGQFRQGDLHGKGVYSDQHGSYQGGFEKGVYHGPGVLRHSDGTVHEGAFAAGLPEGPGVSRDAEGELLGHFFAGQLNGAGEFRGALGERYSGEFANGQFHGQGRYEDQNGEVWSGTFVQGELSGEGEHLAADGSRYSGRFERWQYQGAGRLTYADGRYYQGEFREGRFHGRGTLVKADGTRLEGMWRNDRQTHDEQGRLLADPLELGLLNQGRLLDQALAALPASTDAMELYSLTVAGDGAQSVFRREADYVDRLLAERFAAHGQISLANHRDGFSGRALATRENLARAIQTLAERSGPEDLLFMYFTSHGSADHQLILQQPRLELDNLPAAELAQLLEPLSERNLVLVISACYSGGFIEPLKSPRRLVMTAARSDRTSFGCADENDFTYFGRALFAEALQQTRDLTEAFHLAQARVAEREAADHYEPSEPQLWAPPAVVAHWQALQGIPVEPPH